MVQNTKFLLVKLFHTPTKHIKLSQLTSILHIFTTITYKIFEMRCSCKISPFFFFFGCAMQLVGYKFPDQGLNLGLQP